MATSGGLAGSTGRDLDARFWQSARFNHASNRHINPYKSSAENAALSNSVFFFFDNIMIVFIK